MRRAVLPAWARVLIVLCAVLLTIISLSYVAFLVSLWSAGIVRIDGLLGGVLLSVATMLTWRVVRMQARARREPTSDGRR